MQKAETTDLIFITLSQVIEKVSLGGSTILRWEKLGQFPEAVRLSSTKRVWLKSDIDRWMLENKKSRSRIAVVTA